MEVQVWCTPESMYGSGWSGMRQWRFDPLADCTVSPVECEGQREEFVAPGVRREESGVPGKGK